MEEEGATFAAGLETVVVVLPLAGSVERWNLKTQEREVAHGLAVQGEAQIADHGLRVQAASPGTVDSLGRPDLRPRFIAPNCPEKRRIDTMRLLNPLFALLDASTDPQLARMVEFLKAENRILHGKLPAAGPAIGLFIRLLRRLLFEPHAVLL